jgi:integrase
LNGYRTGDNPIDALAPGKGIPARVRAVRHHPALPSEEVCQFVLGLGEGQSSAAKLAFEFLILTACRTSEVLGARWDEIVVTERSWLVPSARMKGERRKRNPRSHVVLLSDLSHRRGAVAGHSTNAFDGYIDSRGMTGKASAHGHSSFKRWAGTETTFDKDAIEIALARTIGDTVEGAYWRNDPISKSGGPACKPGPIT